MDEDEADRRESRYQDKPISRRRAVSSVMMAAATAQAARGSDPLWGQDRTAAAPSLDGMLSVLDFGADPTGRNDSSSAFQRALKELGGGMLFVPRGTYLVERLGVLGAAGQRIIGESRWRTVLRSERGAGPVFFSEVAQTGTTAFHELADFMIDLNGNDVVAIDLASVNASTIQRLHLVGGTAGARVGTGIRFAAPRKEGAYDNSVYDCSFEYLDRGVKWDTGANNNSLFNCRILNCRVGLDAAPGGEIDTPRVFGGRVEGCDVGLLEGASYGSYFAVRFEDSRTADVEFARGSEYAGFWGGYTATTRLAVRNLELAMSPRIESADLGDVQVEESDARPRISTGRHVFARSGKAPAANANRDYAAFFADYVLMANGVGLELAASNNLDRIVALASTGDDELTIPAFNRQTRTYATINFGGGPAIRPLQHAATDLGTSQRAYRRLYVSGGLQVNGATMLSGQQPAIADDRSGTASSGKLNEILRALRALGLIAG